MSYHRDAKPIPTDPAARKARIQWLLGHKVWTYPSTMRMPRGSLAEMFGTGDDGEVTLKLDDPSWEDQTFDEGSLQDCATFDVVYVDPSTDHIEEDDSQNTAFRVWIEAGPWHDMSLEEHSREPEGGWTPYNRWLASHDIRLDCGAPTMEEALLELATMVECFYNEDGTDKNLWWCSWSEQACIEGEGGYCTQCGFHIEKETKG